MRRAIRLVLISLLALLLLAASALVWLTASESGLPAALRLAGALSGGHLQSTGATGRLIGPLQIEQLVWDDGKLRVEAGQLALDWSPSALWGRRLQIERLAIEQLTVSSPPQDAPAPPPADVLLPFGVTVDDIAIARLAYNKTLDLVEVSGRFASDGRQHKLAALHAVSGEIVVEAEAALDGLAPLPLAARGKVVSHLAGRPVALSFAASGPLARLALRVDGQEGVTGHLEAELTPFAETAFASASVALAAVNPADWRRGAPNARLALQAELRPSGAGVAGAWTLTNGLAGPFDQQRLPLARFSGQLDWPGGAARLTDLAADFGGGRLSGQGRWQPDQEGGRLDLDLSVTALDAAQLASTLRRTRLNGSLRASIGGQRQQLETALQDGPLALDLNASHSASQLELKQLALRRDAAQITASGQLALDGKQALTLNGVIDHVDPSRFAHLPRGRIDAQFAVTGALQPQPQIEASFTIDESRIKGQRLSGQGQINIAWPHVRQADVELFAGVNSLRAAGAFGRPGDSLTLSIAAPQLEAFGLEGGFDGELELSGGSANPALRFDLRAPLLGRSGLGRVRDLALSGEASRAPDAPLQLALNLGRLDDAELTPLLRQLHVTLTGSQRAHKLEAAVELPAARRLALTAAGALTGEIARPGWRGQLLTAQSEGADAVYNVRLAAPADLALAADAWSFGPARLMGEPLDWRATVAAAAQQGVLRADVEASGTRLGTLTAHLDAALLDPWTLNRKAPWQGRLDAGINDLGWLGELLGEGWQSGGSLNGHLELLGTPQEPLASGRFQGERLLLRQNRLGLHLANGDLLLELDQRLLRLSRLHFDSLLQAMPRALKNSNAELTALTKAPGKLQISGELAFDPAGGQPQGALDVHLERFGPTQLAEQWLLLSGDGRLDWNGERIGIRGKFMADAGYWQLAPAGLPKLSDDVVVRRSGQVDNAWRPQIDLDLTGDLGRNFLFSGAGLSSRLAGEVRLLASGRDLPRASGSVRLRDGRFDAYGQQLTISRGLLNFQGLLDNPALDVLAVRQGLAVEPGVQISGTAQRPVIRLVSTPELPDAEKLSWLILGHGPDAVGGGDASLLLFAAGGLLGNDAGTLTGQLKETFGIDVFTIRQGELGGDSRPYGSRLDSNRIDTTASTGNQILSIGKRLSSNAMLSYEQVLGGAEGIVKLTIDLSRQIALIGRAGSDNAVDIFYTVTFGRARGQRTED
ncbi:MAG: translocation/assembly module TamB domain-containing protein [Azonexus sp.]|jgi:translocation and assembly module TamB|nr:translocation/assembly module TamB domain-containing protein [Azonexus sp.]